LEILTFKRPPTKSIVFDTYWKFAAERQNIFFRRINEELVWTKDKILLKHKFTNAYRASDRVSQFLISDVIYKGDQSSDEVLFRILLFKIFNKIETWNILLLKFGVISVKTFDFKLYNQVFLDVLNSGKPIYSGAYIMTSGKSRFGYSKKHQNHLKLLELFIKNEAYKKIEQLKSLKDLFLYLKEYPTIGNFLAYQYAIDINYSEICNFDEMDFVEAGPGAKDGIRKCFSKLGDYTESDIIHYMTDIQDKEFSRLGLAFKNLWGRRLNLIDCQNLFCEVDKYSRVAHPNIQGVTGRTRIKQIFRPNKNKLEYWFPPKWNINGNIEKYYSKLSPTTMAIE